MNTSKHIPLEKIHILQDAIGWLDNYKHSKEESHKVARNKFEKDGVNTDLLLELGKINSRREKIIEQLYNNSINGNK
jgi:hypothetical protein